MQARKLPFMVLFEAQSKVYPPAGGNGSIGMGQPAKAFAPGAARKPWSIPFGFCGKPSRRDASVRLHTMSGDRCSRLRHASACGLAGHSGDHPAQIPDCLCVSGAGRNREMCPKTKQALAMPSGYKRLFQSGIAPVWPLWSQTPPTGKSLHFRPPQSPFATASACFQHWRRIFQAGPGRSALPGMAGNTFHFTAFAPRLRRRRGGADCARACAARRRPTRRVPLPFQFRAPAPGWGCRFHPAPPAPNRRG